MTVPSQQSSVRYATDGTTTDFPVPFYFIADYHLVVTIGDDSSAHTLMLGTDYSVSGAGQQSGGTVTLLQPREAGLSLFIERDPPFTQETAYQRNDAFPERAHERALDKLTMLAQQLRLVFSRSLRFPVEFPIRNPVLPRASLRARKALIFDDSGNVTVGTDDYEDQAENAAESARQAAESATQAGAARDEAQRIANEFGDLEGARDQWEAAVQQSQTAAAEAEADANRADAAADASELFSKAVLYFTLAGLQADTSPSGTLGVVMNDPDPHNNGYYLTDGTTWTRTYLQPADRDAVIRATSAFGDAWASLGNGRAPIAGYGLTAGVYVVDLDGVVLDGPTVTSQLGIEIDTATAQAPTRAPISGYGRAGGDYTVDLDGVVLGGSELFVQVFAEIDATNARIDEIDAGGAAVPESVEPVFTDAGVLKKYGARGVDTILAPPDYQFVGPAQWRGASIITATDRAWGAGAPNATAVGMFSKWVKRPVAFPSGRRLITVIMSFGQSNSVGAQAYASLLDVYSAANNKWPGTLRMMAGAGFMDIRLGLPSGQEAVGSETVLDPNTLTGFKPLQGLQSQLVPGEGVTPLEGFGFAFSDAMHKHMGVDPNIVMFAPGWGGRTYPNLRKGTIPYQNGLAALQRLKALAAVEDADIWMPFILLVHGETDSLRPQYMSDIFQWQVDWEADVRAITGQTAAVKMVCSQASTFTGANVSGVLAPYAASKANSNFILAAPYYPYGLVADNLHLGPNCVDMGEKCGHAAARAIGVFGADQYGTVMPTSVTYDGNLTIDIEFYVPVPPLVQDTLHPLVNSPSPENWGFEVLDGAGALVGIASVAFTGPSSVRIICDAVPAAGAARCVQYALKGFPSPKVTGQGPRGQLRDSDTIVSYRTGEAMPNWCPHFREAF